MFAFEIRDVRDWVGEQVWDTEEETRPTKIDDDKASEGSVKAWLDEKERNFPHSHDGGEMWNAQAKGTDRTMDDSARKGGGKT